MQVPSSVRGLLISLKEALICVGVLSGYTAGYLCAEQARCCILVCSAEKELMAC